ncbi:nitroreductase family protein [Thalassobaculum sp.]|uniref:nitroreductase family protein n=1 Tax=Thalassobaculum sp. TaxID=2022740 RepID=UPI0032EDBCCD
MRQPVMQPLADYHAYPDDAMQRRAREFADNLKRRRTVRDYVARDVPREVLEHCLRAAASAPSGANMQPWHFAVITDPAVKRRIRLAAEEEEREFYRERAPQEWLEALAPLGTDEHKPFLEHATLIAIFAQRHGALPDGRRVKHYYVAESLGIATGFLIAALHDAGLATLTHTPSPMGFLNEICQRPENEKPYLLLVTGFPTPDCRVPEFGGTRKPMDEVTSWF